jgi:hypothetical protein
MGWLFTKHKDSLLPHPLVAISNFLAPSQVAANFLAPLPGRKEDFCEGSFCTHILYFVIVLLYFIYFTCIAFIKTQKKLESLVVVFTCLLSFC